MKTRKGKPRYNPDKFQNKYNRCPYDDGSFGKECGWPWAWKCNGSIHNCKKLRFQYLASLSETEKEKFCEKHKNSL